MLVTTRASTTPLTIDLRPARMDDIYPILSLHREAFADKFGAAFGARGTARGIEAMAEAWRRQGSAALRGMLVAVADNLVIGTITLRTWEMGGDSTGAAEMAFHQVLGAWGALRSIFESLAAFARGGFLRFGVRTLLRGPTSLVRFLAALLVPWTALLALAPAQPWFPSPAVKWSWVGFDVLLAAGLFRLLGRWRQGLATALASAVSLDAALTLAQAVLWNAPRTRGLLDGLVVAAACAGPALAALLLWGAIRTRRVEAVL